MYNWRTQFLATCLLVAVASAAKLNSRIYRGLVSERNQFPYYVFLEKQMASGIVKSCGASLISSDWVLTAAHCVEDARRVALHFGMHETKNKLEAGRVIWVVESTRENIFIHPSYAQLDIVGDIALIKLNQSIPFSESIQSIDIAESFDVDAHEELITIGNGKKGSTGELAEKLEWIPVVSISETECRKFFPIIFDRKSIFCAQNKDDRSVSFGDSGGPIVRKSDNKLVGISSFIHGIGTERGYPQAFTDITIYEKWIKTKTGEIESTGVDWFSDWFDRVSI